ncbi:MAG: leucine-rich repeat domain-containing protein, partial [Lachnospiraceae bacterium]|nr:leucine-rich repeat domain-containing protein [Lachnospiraceae bacterium]
MSKLNQAEADKIAVLEQAVINDTPDEVARRYKELGEVIFTAHILGIACRFRGVEMVKVLVENGASFRYDSVTIQYKSSELLGDYYVTYLPDYFTLFLLKDGTYEESFEAYLSALTVKVGGLLVPVCEEERIRVIKYLCDNAGRACFQPGNLLYYTILTNDKNVTAALKDKGITISDEKKKMLTEGGGGNARYAFQYYIEKMNDVDFIQIMYALLSEAGMDKKLHFTEGIAYTRRENFFNPKFFMFFLKYFNQSKMNKTKLLKDIINRENVSCLEVAADQGWLKTPRKRDEIIQYAMDNKKTECTAFLLEYKNRTADLAVEQEKAEKKLMRELNANPNSLTQMRKKWGFTKKEDSTLIITSYKGNNTEISVPEKIGNDTVIEIANFAFSPYAPRITMPMREFRGTITEIILPKSIKLIGNSAFCMLTALQEIVIQTGVQEIGEDAFNCCMNLTDITIPATVEKIGQNAFNRCRQLNTVHMFRGLKEIDGGVFSDCSSLKNITIPGTVEKIGRYAFVGCGMLEEVCIGKGVRE